jgi:hypothetical protein
MNRLERANARQRDEDLLRTAIRLGLAEKMPNGDYRIDVGGIVHIRGGEYVERMMAWGRES